MVGCGRARGGRSPGTCRRVSAPGCISEALLSRLGWGHRAINGYFIYIISGVPAALFTAGPCCPGRSCALFRQGIIVMDGVRRADAAAEPRAPPGPGDGGSKPCSGRAHRGWRAAPLSLGPGRRQPGSRRPRPGASLGAMLSAPGLLIAPLVSRVQSAGADPALMAVNKQTC